MKFLVTGSIRSSRGPRFIIRSSTVILLFFLAGRIILEFYEAGFFLMTKKDTPVAAVLERAHADFFFNGMLFLFTASVIRELLAIKHQNIVLHLLFWSALVYPVCSIAVSLILIPYSSMMSSLFFVFFAAVYSVSMIYILLKTGHQK